jgi:hypothetical protein
MEGPRHCERILTCLYSHENQEHGSPVAAQRCAPLAESRWPLLNQFVARLGPEADCVAGTKLRSRLLHRIGSLLLGLDRKFSKDDRHEFYEDCRLFVQIVYFCCRLFQ